MGEIYRHGGTRVGVPTQGSPAHRRAAAASAVVALLFLLAVPGSAIAAGLESTATVTPEGAIVVSPEFVAVAILAGGVIGLGLFSAIVAIWGGRRD